MSDFSSKVKHTLQLVRTKNINELVESDKNEFYITTDLIKTILLNNEYPLDLMDTLDGYCIDLASYSVHRHFISQKKDTPTSLCECIKIFNGYKKTPGKGKGLITNEAWNKTIDDILKKLD